MLQSSFRAQTTGKQNDGRRSLYARRLVYYTDQNPNSKYDKFMLLSYPNDSSLARFNRLKENGYIPKIAKIGGDVGIHGVWKGGDDMIEMGVGWTYGCVAIKNKDIEELFSLVGVGTKVTIKR